MGEVEGAPTIVAVNHAPVADVSSIAAVQGFHHRWGSLRA